jgi:hypothetical protein
MRENIEECLEVLTDVCRLFGYKGKVNLQKSVDHWMAITEESGAGWMKIAKYKLAAFFAFYTHQTLPQCPFNELHDRPENLFGGRLGRFVSVFLKRADRPTKMSFLSSIKQAKKGMPRADAKELKRAETKFIDTMTQVTEQKQDEEKGEWLVDWSTVEENTSPEISLQLSRASFEQQLRRTVKEVFKGHTLSTADRVSAFFPSTSANYINSRSNAGAIGAILEHPTLLRGLRRPGGYLRFQTQEEEQIESEDWISGSMQGEDADFQTAFTTLWVRLLGEASREENTAEPVALPEALKIRVITKGPPFIQTTLRCIQKHMHSVMRRLKTFRLIGEPVTEKYILEVLGAVLAEDEGFLSGDYEAATDNLKSWVSEVIADAVSEEIKLYSVERRLFIDALIHHKIRGKPQTQGQFMGSIVSFPVLCLAVATIARWALEVQSQKKKLLRDAPIADNGDDLAMKCKQSGRIAWEKISAFAGLKSSVGKTYFSRDFVEINSTQFLRVDPKPFQDFKEEITWKKYPHGRFATKKLVPITRMNPFERTRYVNMGLLRGQKRSGIGRQGLVDPRQPMSNIGARYRELIENCPILLRRAVHRQFLTTNASILEKARPAPWFVPTWIGGLGLLGFAGPSKLDLRVAQMILFNWRKKRPVDISRMDAPWKTWRLAEREVPDPAMVHRKNDGVEYYTKIVAQKCIDLLFDSDKPLEVLFELNSKSNIGAMIGRNQRLWSPNYKTGLPEPIDAVRLHFQPTYSSYQRTPFTSVLPQLD